MPKETPIEDPNYIYTGPVPTQIDLDLSRALLGIPGRFSVQMLADIIAGVRRQGYRAGLAAKEES